MIDQDGSEQIHNQDQGLHRESRTSQGVRQARSAPQAPPRVNASSHQSERAGSRAPASSRQYEVTQATGYAEESTPLGQNSRSRPISSMRAGRASRVRGPLRNSNDFRNGTQAQTDDTEFEELLPREPERVSYYPQFTTQNGNFVSQYHQSGGPMPLQYGQNGQHHHYHVGLGGTVPGVNQGQMPPPLQYENSYSGPTGHSMPNITPQSHQNPYPQPPHYQSFKGLWQPSGLLYANRPARLIEFNPMSDAHGSQNTVIWPQRGNFAEPGSSCDHTVCIWPSHLSVEERHERGIFTREELRQRGMAPPAQPTRRRDSRTDPAVDLSHEETSTASAEGLNPEAINAALADSPDIRDLTSHVDHEPEATTAAAVAASDPRDASLVLPNKGKGAKKRAGSPPAQNSRRPSKKPRVSHGDIYQRPDGTVWFRAFGASVSGKL